MFRTDYKDIFERYKRFGFFQKVIHVIRILPYYAAFVTLKNMYFLENFARKNNETLEDLLKKIPFDSFLHPKYHVYLAAFRQIPVFSPYVLEPLCIRNIVQTAFNLYIPNTIVDWIMYYVSSLNAVAQFSRFEPPTQTIRPFCGSCKNHPNAINRCTNFMKKSYLVSIMKLYRCHDSHMKSYNHMISCMDGYDKPFSKIVFRQMSNMFLETQEERKNLAHALTLLYKYKVGKAAGLSTRDLGRRVRIYSKTSRLLEDFDDEDRVQLICLWQKGYFEYPEEELLGRLGHHLENATIEYIQFKTGFDYNAALRNWRFLFPLPDCDQAAVENFMTHVMLDPNSIEWSEDIFQFCELLGDFGVDVDLVSNFMVTIENLRELQLQEEDDYDDEDEDGSEDDDMGHEEEDDIEINLDQEEQQAEEIVHEPPVRRMEINESTPFKRRRLNDDN